MHMPSLYSGWAGVTSHTTALSSVADNLANQNTSGYKATRAEFHDIMASQLANGSTTQSAIGNGSYLGTQYMLAQGSITTTDNALDLAIDGAGYFTLKQGVSTAGGAVTGSTGTYYYSRAGEFSLNANGFIINSEGYVLQGYLASGDTVSTGALSDLRIDTTQNTGVATSVLEMTLNLDAGDSDTFGQATAIDPADSDTYNFSYTATVYDAAGDSHQITTYYQRLTSFSGTSPAGSSYTWKASSFETATDGTSTVNPTYPGNTYYLHFNTDGQLVGTSQGGSGAGDAYTYSPGFSTTGSAASASLGEEFTYTGAGSAQTYRTTATVTFSGAGALTGDSVTIGADTYSFTSDMTATDAANWLVSQINSDPTHTYFASASAGVVTLHAEAAQVMDVSDSGANIAASDTTSLASLISAINNGVSASGAINLTSLAAGDTVTVAGQTFTQGVDFTDAATLASAINTAALGVTASSNGGSDVFLSASSAGSAGNALTLAATGGIAVSGATLSGGLDDSATSLVTASAVSSGSSQYLHLARSDVGASATLTVAADSTLGASQSLDFNTATQTSVATDAGDTAETEGEVALTFSFDGVDQAITWDYTPTAASASTMQAGDSEVLYVYQDGSPLGEFETLQIDENGYIYAVYSNNRTELLGAVALSNFTAPGNLTRSGDNLWYATADAGTVTVGLPGDQTMGLGSIESGALESSNVDVATEIVNLINYQRAYQANAKSITTSDEMLKEAINMKR